MKEEAAPTLSSYMDPSILISFLITLLPPISPFISIFISFPSYPSYILLSPSLIPFHIPIYTFSPHFSYF